MFATSLLDDMCWRGACLMLGRCLPDAGEVPACLPACMPCRSGYSENDYLAVWERSAGEVLERCLPACLMHASEDLGAQKRQILTGITPRICEFGPEVLERCWRGACLLACMHALQTWVLRSRSF